MLQSPTKLNKAMFELLYCLKNEGDLNKILDNYKSRNLDFNEVVTTCLKQGYVIGISCTTGTQDNIILNLSSPHITVIGELFIQQNT